MHGKDFELGILLVHGIGTQPAGDTLIHWGEAFLHTLRTCAKTPDLSRHHLLDLPKFAAVLASPKDPVSTCIQSRLDLQTRTILDTCNRTAASNEKDATDLANRLVNDLNCVIRGPSIYDSQRFAKVSLRPATKALLAQHPDAQLLVRLNRLLLEDAYPDLISRVWSSILHAEITAAHSACPAKQNSAKLELHIAAPDSSERWLISEGWWAESFPAPSYGEFVSWAVRALPWAITLHVAQGYWQMKEQADPPQPRTLLSAAITGGKLALALLAFPFLAILLLIPLTLAIVPPLRAFSINFQSRLTATVGDCFAFVKSPVRAALIRTSILQQLAILQNSCAHSLVLAHSQGAAVVLDALGAIKKDSPQNHTSPQDFQSNAATLPNTLVTFGAGTNQLGSLRLMESTGALAQTFRRVVLTSLIAMSFIVGMAAWLFHIVSKDDISTHAFSVAALAIAAIMLVAALLPLLAKQLINAFIRRGFLTANKSDKVYRGILLISMIALTAALIYLGGPKSLPITPVLNFLLAGFILAATVIFLLGQPLKRFVSSVVQKPKDLVTWVDIYASADPVPHGPTRATEVSRPTQSIQISNEGSILTDHTTYLANKDAFLVRIVRLCADTAGSLWKHHLSHNYDYIDARAAWRVKFLRIAFIALSTLWIGVGAALWFLHNDTIPLLWKPLQTAPLIVVGAARLAGLVAVIAGCAWLSFNAARFVWRKWVHIEQEASLQGPPYDSTPQSSFAPVIAVFLIGILLAVVLIICLYCVTSSPGTSYQLFDSVWDFAMSVFGFGLFLALLLTRILPPPAHNTRP